MAKKKLKILVVDDSAFMRLLITDLISEDDDIEVVATATNGLEAAEKVKELSPDLVLLDLNMAEYDGLFAVKSIMKDQPTPILILSSVGNTNLDPIFEALKYGAVDYMNKPNRNNSKMRSMSTELISKIKSVSRARPHVATEKTQHPIKNKKSTKKSKYKLIAIGASTGGPTAIEQIICALPADFSIPIIVCQHMPGTFIASFVNRLNSQANLNVIMATKSQELIPGSILICPGYGNLIVKKAGSKCVVDFTEEKYREYNNPSINAMMSSVSECYGSKSVGVLLTGMGKDGVVGLKKIMDAGGHSIAQDKESCVIYGMPKVAVENNAVDISLNIKEIGNYLVNNL